MVVEKIEKEVERVCQLESNLFGYGIWSHHIVSVLEYAKQLAEITHADTEVVEIAALLHDYASIKDYSMYYEHHIHSANEAEVLLKALDYPTDKIELVKECIRSHRGSVVIEKGSKEAICVADADAIAHIVNVPSLLFLAYTNKGMGISDGAQWVSAKIQRSWCKLSETAKALVEEEFKAALKILQ